MILFGFVIILNSNEGYLNTGLNSNLENKVGVFKSCKIFKLVKM